HEDSRWKGLAARGATLEVVTLGVIERLRQSLGSATRHCSCRLAAPPRIARAILRALERDDESFVLERLQAVVDRVGVERLESVSVVCGHEYHDRDMVLGRHAQYREPVEPGHLDVQKGDVGPEIANRRRGVAAARACGDDVHVRITAE